MKVPSADYTPIAEALSAKSNAIQASYSAQNARSWENKYRINEESLALQEKANNQSFALSIADIAVNTVGKLVNIGADYYEQKQNDIYQKAMSDMTAASTDAQNLINNNPQLLEYNVDEETGIVTTGLSEEGKKQIEVLYDKYFPQDKKYGWGADDYVKELKENAISSTYSYAESLKTEQMKTEAETAYAFNLSTAASYDAQSIAVNGINDNTTIAVSIPDGKGGERTVRLGKETYAVINTRGKNASDEWRYNQYILAEQTMNSNVETELSNLLTNGFSTGSFLLNPDEYDLALQSINSYLDTLPESQRNNKRQELANYASNGFQLFIENETIKSEETSNTTYSDLMAIRDELSDGGSYYKIATDENSLLSGTGRLAAAQSYVDAKISSLENEYGTTKTDNLKAEIESLRTSYKAGEISASEYGLKFKTLMTTAYGENFASNPEAYNITKNFIFKDNEEALKDPIVEARLNILYNTLYKNKDYEKLEPEEQLQFTVIKQDVINELIATGIENPAILAEPTLLSAELEKIITRYSDKYVDIINTDTSSVSSIGKETKTQIKTLNTILETYSKEAETAASEKNTINFNSVNVPLAVKQKANESIAVIGEFAEKEIATFGHIDNKQGGTVIVEKDDDGNKKAVAVQYPITLNENPDIDLPKDIGPLVVEYNLEDETATVKSINGSKKRAIDRELWEETKKANGKATLYTTNPYEPKTVPTDWNKLSNESKSYLNGTYDVNILYRFAKGKTGVTIQDVTDAYEDAVNEDLINTDRDLTAFVEAIRYSYNVGNFKTQSNEQDFNAALDYWLSQMLEERKRK